MLLVSWDQENVALPNSNLCTSIFVDNYFLRLTYKDLVYLAKNSFAACIQR
jgi:hypothetical protein